MQKLKNKTIDAIRNFAITFEAKDMEIARELMLIANAARPNGPFIKKKLDEYTKKLNIVKPVQKIRKLVSTGEVAIIPIGFRCHTKEHIRKSLGISQPSLPFDVGFFSPSAVARILKKKKVNLKYPDNGSTHCVCIKNENFNDPIFGHGIKFEKSTYEEINAFAISRDADEINKYLDSTFGYYTLDIINEYVLAHYNWHKFADKSKSKGVTDPKLNLNIVNDVFDRRIKRMFDICNSAKYIFFVFGNYQNYRYMMVDDKYFDLNDLRPIENAVKDVFQARSFVIHADVIDDPGRLLEMINT